MDADVAHPTRTLRVGRPADVRRGHLPLGEPADTPDRIEVTGGRLERDGRPWFPVTGEVHFSRVPRERWSEVLGHARAGGLTSVATYVFWNAHEPAPGDFRWDGDLDLRAFVVTAAENGLDVVLRLGPWAHGESRHGGFPDWLVARDLATRTNDPAYLELARRFYGETIAQVADLTHASGGPVVAAQVDNELYDRPEHLARLRETAEDLGLRVPVWTATGWGGAQVPDTLLPVYGAYSDGFWDEAGTDWPAYARLHFRYTHDRDDLGVGADVRAALDGVTSAAVARTDDTAFPFATCELGGGMHVAYHRRPLVTPEDVAALALAKIGSGSVWQGYYVYAGGTQRSGAEGTQQESHATGYPNDVPTRSYDFAAPVGEHGQVRRHHHLLRRQHLWLAEEGPALAAMSSVVGGGSDDPAELRWAVRSDGRRGYVFVTTYQPARRPLAAQPGVRFTVEFDDDAVTLPRRPVDLPAGVSVAWPVNYPLTDALVLRSATAQLLTRTTVAGDRFVVLVATDGVPAELVLEGRPAVSGTARAQFRDGATVVELTRAPGPTSVVELPGVRVVVLDEATANRLYALDLDGARRLVLSDAPLYAGGGGLVLHTEQEEVTLAVLTGRAQDPWSTRTLAVAGSGTTTLLRDLHPVAPAPPAPRRGGPADRLSAPTDFSGAARVHVDVPARLLTGTDRVLLRIDWTGDVGRAVVDGVVVSDHFWHGRVWELDLTPRREEVARTGLDLELLPWRAATGVFVDPSVREVPDGVHVRSVEVVRVARVVVRPGVSSTG